MMARAVSKLVGEEGHCVLNFVFAAIFGFIAGLSVAKPRYAVGITVGFIFLDVISLIVDVTVAPIYLTAKTFSLSHIEMSQVPLALPWAIIATIMHMMVFAVFFPVGMLVRHLFRTYLRPSSD